MKEQFDFGGEIVWWPSQEYIDQARLTEFMNQHEISDFSELMKRWELFLALVAVKCFGTFLGGVCCGRTARSHHYGYAAMASFLATLASAVLPLAGALAGGSISLKEIMGSGLYLLVPFWLLYVLCAMIGARAGRLDTVSPALIRHDSCTA